MTFSKFIYEFMIYEVYDLRMRLKQDDLGGLFEYMTTKLHKLNKSQSTRNWTA